MRRWRSSFHGAVEALADPECQVEVWWGYAFAFPQEAQASALYPLLTLENPGRWEEIKKANQGNWRGIAWLQEIFPALPQTLAKRAQDVLFFWEWVGSSAALWYDAENGAIVATWFECGCTMEAYIFATTQRLVATMENEGGGERLNWEIWEQGMRVLSQLPDIHEGVRRTWG